MKPIVTIDRDTYGCNLPGAALRLLLVMMMCGMMAMTSCRSHRHVVRGDQGTEMVRGGKHTGGKKEKAKPGHVDSGKSSVKPPHTGDKYVDMLFEEAYSWIGTPYLFGGKTRKGADCSGFVMMSFIEALDIKLPRLSREQGEYCRKIRKSDLEPGDLVFFWTSKEKDRVTHVGIYVGDNNMIHASSTKGVCVSPIDSKYFSEHYHHSGRVEELEQLRKKKRR